MAILGTKNRTVSRDVTLRCPHGTWTVNAELLKISRPADRLMVRLSLARFGLRPIGYRLESVK